MSRKQETNAFSKQWFSCSFDHIDQPHSTITLSPASVTHPTSSKATDEATTESCNQAENLPHIMDVDGDDVVFLCDSFKKSSQPKKCVDQMECYESIADRFVPTNTSELAVHNKKIEQVREWMLNHRNGMRRSKLLLLTGPCGSGKTATVKVLCRELRMELVEWESPDHYDFSYDQNGEEVLCEQSQVRVFADFLKSVDHGSLETAHVQKVVLIEQLPNVFYREPSLLHSLLRSYASCSRCMFIFVLSSIESCWALNPRRLFPTSMLRELYFDTVSFNPSAVTFLSKAIRRILTALSIKATPSQIKYIAESSAGDIRCAINNLQLSIAEDGRLLNDVLLFGSSSQTDPFHSIGKILYGKRAETESTEWVECENLLSEHLRERFHRPRPPKDLLEDVIHKTAMSGDNIAAYLEEHEPYFAESLSEIRAVFDNISLIDSALGSWEVRMNPSLDKYEAEIAARSAVFYNYGSSQNSSLFFFYLMIFVTCLFLFSRFFVSCCGTVICM
ncbi:Cell cycle checkpoint protein RAD17 [Toxocara canis]|uniref:Cell cycle checkpoint protein RAD17 n=1 Tax=Toxocara canis TaxID=6265 RepID=A0A0B2VCY9_TOXCA|nr:Cell cycle checkpoint protein RAD17 [Toxocara canis]